VNWRELLGARQELGKRRREKATFKKNHKISRIEATIKWPLAG